VNPGDKGNGLDPNDSASLTPFNTKYHEGTPVMQFTGLVDRNGKEIYEGDLLRYPGDNTHFTAYEVFFHDGDANPDYNIGYSINRTHYQGSICGGIIPSFKPNSVSHMEVCGNIYENKELLSSKA
jgi:uncharacterized phage protein (TIGR01671 family)